jgi:hypothetical protein
MDISEGSSTVIKVVGFALLALAGFMLLGFLRSNAEPGAPATIAALLVTIALPALGGIALLTKRFRGSGRLAERREMLRQQTYESEILRLAAQRQGRLTVVELVTEFAITPEKANELLESLMVRQLADVEVTDSGVVVYVFHDVKNLGDKPRARGILDA